jgi:MvaI/BcnI restriction endonuclease family
MGSRIPQSSQKAFPLIQEIIKLGTIKIPDEFQGNGAPGNTLESLLNLKQNNNDSPDLLDWEIKFHGGNSLLTLFHKDPQPKGIMDVMVDTFGWNNKKGQLSFRHTISGTSARGFCVINADGKIMVSNINNATITPYWEHNTILNAIGAKLRRLILVHGTVSKDKRQVTYQSAQAYWDLDLVGICEAIKEGVIYIDFDARTKEGRGSSIRNHGTKFRVHIQNIGRLYESTKPII